MSDFNRPGLLGVLILALLFSGCQFFKQNPGTGENDAQSELETTLEEVQDVAAEEEELFSNQGPKPVIDNYRPIRVTTRDGITLAGTLYVPGLPPYNPEAEEEEDDGDEENGESSKPVKPAKTQYPLVVLCHMLSGDRWEWKEMPRHLVNAGYAVLALDLRGHGESVHQGSRLKVWREFDRSDWQKMPEDIGTVLNYIAKKPEFNMVNTRNIALLGASIGANVAVNYASKHARQVKALVLLSPGLEYQGIQTFDPLTHYENAIYFLASKEDAYASDSTERLYKFALGKKKIQIFKDLGHGTDMLMREPDLTKHIVEWLTGILTPQGMPKTAKKTDESQTSPVEASEKDRGTKTKDTTNKPVKSESVDKPKSASTKPKEEPSKTTEKPKTTPSTEKPKSEASTGNKPKPSPQNKVPAKANPPEATPPATGAQPKPQQPKPTTPQTPQLIEPVRVPVSPVQPQNPINNQNLPNMQPVQPNTGTSPSHPVAKPVIPANKPSVPATQPVAPQTHPPSGTDQPGQTAPLPPPTQ